MSEALIPYNDMVRMSQAIATSGLFGVRTPEQAIALMLIAQAEGLHPAIAARDYDIIQGRPAKKSEAMMRAFLAAGGSVQWHELSDTRAEATFSHPQGGTVRLDWTMERAAKAGLTQKVGSMYAKYPRSMLRARLISEGVRTICPLATSGMYTPEESQDMADEGPVNIETRRRTGQGYTREQLPESTTTETVESLEETRPGIYEPLAQKTETTTAEWFKRIESATDAGTLAAIGEELKTATLSDDDKTTARRLFAARRKDILKSSQPADGPHGGGSGEASPSAAQSDAPWI